MKRLIIIGLVALCTHETVCGGGAASGLPTRDTVAKDTAVRSEPTKNSRLKAPLQAAEVYVSGRRTPREAALTVTVIDSARLTETTNASLADLLAKHTPVFIKSYGQGSLATVSFRGTSASHTKVEWNGLTINSPMLGQVDFSMLPVWTVDRAELLHGGSSLATGSGALGGSVILQSTPRWNDKFYVSAMEGIGSFGLWQNFLSIGGGNHHVQARVRYIYEQSRGDFKFRNTAIPPFEYQKQSNSDYAKHTATADLNFNLGRNHFLDLNTWFNTADRNLPQIMSYEGKGRTEWQRDNEWRAALHWRWYGRGVRSRLTAGYTHTDMDYYLANATELGQVVNYDSRSRANTFQAKYNFEWDISPATTLRFLADASVAAVGITDRTTSVGYSATRTDVGITASVHQRFGSVVSGYLLLRWENAAGWIPSLGVEVEPIKNLLLKLGGTRNYHKPTLNDLYWRPGGNPDLQAEQGVTGDLNLSYNRRFTQWGFRAGATGYLSLIDNWIMWRPSEYHYWMADNVKKVLARGVELSLGANYHIGRFSVALSGNYAYTRTTNQQPVAAGDDSQGKQLIYIPVHKANMLLDLNYRGFYFYWAWSFTGERYTTSSNEATRFSLPSYDLSDITLGKRLFGFDLSIKVNNLFSRDYQAILWRAMPSRNYAVLLKYTLNKR